MLRQWVTGLSSNQRNNGCSRYPTKILSALCSLRDYASGYMTFPDLLRGLIVLVLTIPMSLVARQDISEYDPTKSVSVTGFVTKVNWTDPHVAVYINVRDEGRTSNWAMETGSKAELAQAGWTPDRLKVGTEIEVTAYPAKSVPRKAYITKIEMAKPPVTLGAIARR